MSLRLRLRTALEGDTGVRALMSDGRGRILAAIATGWFLSIGVRLVYPVLLPHVREAYALDLTTAGFLLTVLWLAYAVGQLPGGILADRIGEGNILVVSTIISAGTLALVAISGSAVVLYLATILFGLGTALYSVARFTALSQIYPDNDGAAYGVTLAAGEVGNAVLPLAAGTIAATVAWQFGFGFAVPLFLLVAVGLRAFVPARTSGETSAVDSLSLETVRYVVDEIARPAVVTVVAIQFLLYCVWQSFTGFYPTYLIEAKGLSTPTATGLFSLFFALGVVVQPLSGRAYDRFDVRRSLPIVVGIVAATLAAVPFVEGFWPVVGVTVCMSSLLGYGAITLPYLTSAMPTDMQGTGLGVLRTAYMTTGAASPVAFGALADRGFFDEGFLVLAAIAGLTVLLALWIPGTDTAADANADPDSESSPNSESDSGTNPNSEADIE